MDLVKSKSLKQVLSWSFFLFVYEYYWEVLILCYEMR